MILKTINDILIKWLYCKNWEDGLMKSLIIIAIILAIITMIAYYIRLTTGDFLGRI